MSPRSTAWLKCPAMRWTNRRRPLDLTRRGVVMGILNLTPDSFSDGGLHSGLAAGLAHAHGMLEEGAEILDVGGESTRPGAAPVAVAEELARVVPLIRALRETTGALISIDTSKPAVARAALAAGADIVNDVTGLRDPEMVEVCRQARCGIVIMHMRGDPRTMQQNAHYSDVVAEVAGFFHQRLRELTAAGIAADTLCFDPGIGFGKNVAHNLTLLRHLGQLQVEDRPLLLGVSRKSFIGVVLEEAAMDQRDWPTVALSAWGRDAGVRVHRVHEVRRNVEALRMTEAILHGISAADAETG